MTATFGIELRAWRDRRGLSQLDLASRAEVSQRHISFLETGRSNPSREMVLHLGRALDVPPREQNLLLSAAGFFPAHTETPLADLPDVSAVLDEMLTAHEPHMAMVVDRRWNVVAANRPAFALTARLFPEPPAWMTPPLNLMRLAFHPAGARIHMVDWERSAEALLRRLQREAASHPHDSELANLFDEVLNYPDVAPLARPRRAPEASDLLVSTTYRLAEGDVSFFTTIAVIGDAHDLTLAELRIETAWPIDAASRNAWLAFVADGTS